MVSPGRILSRSTATATFPESRSIVDRPGSSVMVSVERSRTVTSALPPSRSRTTERSSVTIRSFRKTSSLNFRATGWRRAARAAVTRPWSVVTTPALVPWAWTSAGQHSASRTTRGRVALVHTGVLEPLETWALDRLFEFRGARQPSAPIVIVTIDEASNTELHTQWPFPRAMHGALLDRISAGGPLAIGVDLIFDRPSSRGLKDDRALSAAVARAGNVVLAAAPTVDPQTLQQQGISLKRIDENPPLPTIRQGAADVGSVNVFYDADGLIRRVPLRVGVGERTLPGFDAALHRIAARAGLVVAPLPAAAEVLINFRGGPRTFPWLPYYRVLRGEIRREAFQGKIVLVGQASKALQDFHPTPFAGLDGMTGVEIHANALDTLVSGDAIREIPRWVATLVAVVPGRLGSALRRRLPGARARRSAGPVWGILTLGALAGFALGDVWMRGMARVMALYNVPSEDPEHAIKAVRTGLAFQERTLAAAARWEAKFGVRIRNGVGINTGEAIVGILGSRQRFEYTAIGDTVNLAARLESITKDYGASIIVSESTYEHVKGVVATRELGAVTVRGKAVPVKIYAVLATDVRKYPRAVLDAAAALTDAATGLVCRVGTVDISEGGLALADVPADWTVGSTVRLRLEKGALATPIVAEGTIVWRRGAHAGVSFTAIEPESVPVVAEYVAGRKDRGPSTTR